eukprot:351171-Chlamydomonas_euryale.AAC.7
MQCYESRANRTGGVYNLGSTATPVASYELADENDVQHAHMCTRTQQATLLRAGHILGPGHMAIWPYGQHAWLTARCTRSADYAEPS